MALINCVECGNSISDKATACPFCGCPSSYQTPTVKGEESRACEDVKRKWAEIQEIVHDDFWTAESEVMHLTGVQIYEAQKIATYMQEHGAPPDYIVSATKYEKWWDKVQTAVDKGWIGDARKIISKRANGRISESEAEEIIKYMKEHHALPDYIYSPPAEETNPLILCPACNRMISKQTETCPGCGRPTGVHVCPNCGGTNTQTISELSKAGSVLLWGIFAANKVKSTYECLDCKQKF